MVNLGRRLNLSSFRSDFIFKLFETIENGYELNPGRVEILPEINTE